MLRWVNWIYTHDGKACHGFWNEGEIPLERAIKGVEWLKEHTENLDNFNFCPDCGQRIKQD